MCTAVSVRAVRCEREGTMRRGRGAATCALLLLAAALAGASADKRADMSPVPFVMGSRYGRSSPRLMSPRNDKFFMGSRYGKRSEPARSAASIVSPGTSGAAVAAGATGAGGVRFVGGSAAAGALVCEYTGVYPLYRCVKHNKRTRLNRRSFEDSGAGMEE